MLPVVRCRLMKPAKSKVQNEGDHVSWWTPFVHKLFWVRSSVIWNKLDQIILSGWSSYEAQCGMQNLGDRKGTGVIWGLITVLGDGSWPPRAPSLTAMQLRSPAVRCDGQAPYWWGFGLRFLSSKWGFSLLWCALIHRLEEKFLMQMWKFIQRIWCRY